MTTTNESQSQPMASGQMTARRSTEAPRDFGFEIWGATDVGREREGNEDSIFPDSPVGAFYTPKPETLASKGQLLIVADGVGGGKAGSEASQWAIRRVVERYYEAGTGDIATDLRQAVAHANASLTQYLQSTGTTGAGSTMTAAVVHGDKLYVANVGDSRAYLIRNGQIYQQTRDHTLTQQKVDQGLIRPEQAAMDPDSNVLTRSLGAVPSIAVDLFPPVQLEPGDIVLLCSDGLYDMLADADIARLARNGSPRRAVERLISAANKQGGFDNVSVIIAQVEGKSSAAAATAGGLAGLWQGFSSGQRSVILAMLAILAFVILAGSVYAGWRAFGGNGDGDTTPATVEAAEPSTVPPTAATQEAGGSEPQATATPTPTATSDTSGAATDRATSTPQSTSTPTPTPRPTDTPTSTPTSTPTNTPEPTDTPLPPSSGGGGGGGGGGDEGATCSGEKPDCRGGEAVCEDGTWVCKE
ncbi:MAG: PP2C family protein-serine/threonine phosphatase [Anaerolineae bacterium]